MSAIKAVLAEMDSLLVGAGVAERVLITRRGHLEAEI